MTKTIRVSNDTYDKIAKHGKFGDTIDKAIQRLLSKLSKQEQQKKKSK